MDKILSNTVNYGSVTSRHTMPLLAIEFEWWKDAKGYRLVEPETWPQDSPPKPGRYIPVIGITPAEGKRIVPNGGKLFPYQPLKHFNRLYKSFADIKDEALAVDFACKWGLLTSSDGSGELETFLKEAEDFRKSLEQRRPSRKKRFPEFNAEVETAVLADLKASLTTDPRGRLQLRILPSNLLEALWLQLAQTLATGTDIRTCLLCGQFFEVGPHSRKRLDAKFCSDEHRILFNSRRRSKGK
jgi:hypothetical protein